MKQIIFGLQYLLIIAIALNVNGQEKKLKIDKRYLNLPVSNDLETQHVKILIDKEVYREFDIQLAKSDPDFWVFVDLKDKLGKTATLKFEKPVVKSWNLAYVSDNIAGADSLYREKLRPQFHYTSKRGWNNDPNGMVYHNGEYNLYYQHNPYGWNWGNMHWGHAISKDLVHWKELPEAIYPASYHDYVFSGSAVVDKENTSDFAKGNNVPIVAAFTSTGRGECIAYSLDNGLSFKEYENNPVVKHEGRDPKIFWYGKGKHWVMVIYDETAKKTDKGVEYRNRTFHILNSLDLKNWTFQSEISGFYECPELFELAEEGNPSNKKWVMYGANAQYVLGTFDGKTFTPETPKYEMIEGNGYASQTFNNAPEGRRIQISWGMGTVAPGMPFNQIMLFPVELSLNNTEDGLRVFPKPIEAIDKLHAQKHEWKDILISGEKPFSTNFSKDVMHIKAEFQILDDFGFVIDINGFKIEYSAVNYKLNDVFLRPKAGKLKLDILVDKTIIEIFGNDGQAYITKPYIAKENQQNVKVYSTHPHDDNKTILEDLAIYEIKSMWD